MEVPESRTKHMMREITAFAGFVLIAIILGYFVFKGDMLIAGGLIALPFILAFLFMVFKDPAFGLLAAFQFNFVCNGLGRFIPGETPWGLGVDAILVLVMLATIFTKTKQDNKYLGTPVFYVCLLWFLFTLVELVNPEARSKEAWFYANRGLAIYPLQVVGLVLVLFNKQADMDRFIRLWVIWSLISAFYGFKQHYFGVTTGERAWLDAGGKITHELHGRLRIFSFYSDAGQFGAAMAHTCLFAIIMAIGPFEKKVKNYYWFVVAVTFWGYAISGSRGPLFVIVGGFMLFLFLIGNFRILMIGAIIGGMFFVVLKYTHIGDANYQIHRMRTGLDPNDASLQVRLDNQKKLGVYLASRPLGGGIGSGGSWGQRFTPGAFLSQIALDSWFVKVWVETGIVGLTLHIVTLVVILIIGVINVFKLKEPKLRQKMIALTCGYFGIALASYGNQILGQFPTGFVLYFTWVYMYMCIIWENEEAQNTRRAFVKIS